MRRLSLTARAGPYVMSDMARFQRNSLICCRSMRSPISCSSLSTSYGVDSRYLFARKLSSLEMGCAIQVAR